MELKMENPVQQLRDKGSYLEVLTTAHQQPQFHLLSHLARNQSLQPTVPRKSRNTKRKMQLQIVMEQMVLQAPAFFSLGLSQIQLAQQYLVVQPVNHSQLNQVNSKIPIPIS